MADDCQTRLPPQACFSPEHSHPHHHLPGIAALDPQFDQAITTPRRSAPPIGSLSPDHPLNPAFLSSSLPNTLPKSHYPFAPPPPISHGLPPSPPLTFAPLVPSVPAADFLAEFSASSVPSHLPPIAHARALPFDLFGLTSLDLGPPVVPSPSPPHCAHRPHIRPDPSSSSSLSPPPPHPPHPHHAFPPSPPRAARRAASALRMSSSPPSARPARELSHPTRCVLLRNIPPGVDDDDLRALLQRFGPLRDLGAQQRSRGGRGSVLATFFDLRHARDAVRLLDGNLHFGRKLDARFQCPVDSYPLPASPTAAGQPLCPSVNQGTLVVFNLDISTSAEDIRALFSKIGDVKEIRATPNKKHHKFVEFYDVRDAEQALLTLNKSEVAGKRIKIEISRPGGRANGASRAATASKPVPIASNPHWKTCSPRTPTFDASAAAMSGPASSVAFGSSVPTASSALPFVLAEERGASYGGGAGVLRRTSMDSHPVMHEDDSFAFHALSTSFPPLGSGLATERDVPGKEPNGASSFVHAGGDGLASSLDRSLDRSLKSVHAVDEEMELASVYKMFGIADMDEKECGGGGGGMVNVGGTGKHDSYMQALYHSASSDDGRGIGSSGTDESPGRTLVGVDDGGLNGMHGLHDDLNNGMLDVGATVSSGKLNGMGGKALGGKMGVGMIGCYSPTHSKYSLDMTRIRAGDETRTALMIRNIPNKYNQKMLVSTLEEGHKGHFDFIYLPIDFKNKCNVGYAFINLTKAEYIEAFYEAFHGKKWGRFNSEKNSSLLLEDPKCRPVIFDRMGRQEEFPIGSHVRTRRGPSSRDCGQRVGESGSTSPPYSPSKHRGHV